MATEGPIPRLSLDIDDLLCSWEESGSGSIFEFVSGSEGPEDVKFHMDDPQTCQLLDLSDIQANMTAPKPVHVPDIDISAFLVPPADSRLAAQRGKQATAMPTVNTLSNTRTPAPLAIPPLLDQSAFRPAACMDWTNSFFSMSKPPMPQQYLTPPDNAWSNASSMEFCSITTPDSRHTLQSNYPSAAVTAHMLFADRALCGKNSCDSWCTSMPDMPALLPSFNPMMIGAMQPPNLSLSQLQAQCLANSAAMMIQPPMYPLEVVDTSCCHANQPQPPNTNNRYLNSKPSLPTPAECTMQVVDAPVTNPATHTQPQRRRNTPPTPTAAAPPKAPQQSSSSSTSVTEIGGPHTANLATARSDSPMAPLDLSRPSSSGTHSPTSPHAHTHGHSSLAPIVSLPMSCGRDNTGTLPPAYPLAPMSMMDEEQQRRMGMMPWLGAAPCQFRTETSPCSSVGIVQVQNVPCMPVMPDVEACMRKTGSLLPRTACQPPAASDEYNRTRAEAVERYRQKRARRAYTKKIRYQLRKINADRRPRIKGRFVKKEEMHLYAHLFTNTNNTRGVAGSTGGTSSSNDNNQNGQEELLAADAGSDLEIEIDGLDMEGDMEGDAWSLE